MLQPLEDSLDFLIRDTRRLLLKRIEARVTEHGIPLGAWFPLRILYEEDGITQRQLSRKLGYLDAAAGAIVEVMEKLDLVRRQRNAEDRRKINVFLTPLGRRIGKKTLVHMREINAQLERGFTKKDAATLRALLHRAHDNLSVRD
jgi:DNA-binding MarR family transcriptional regulator